VKCLPQKKRALDEAPDGVYFKVKKGKINWEKAKKVKLDAAIQEWRGGTMRPDRSGGPLSRGFSLALQHNVRKHSKVVTKDL
jgi:hypothetical protein